MIRRRDLLKGTVALGLTSLMPPIAARSFSKDFVTSRIFLHGVVNKPNPSSYVGVCCFEKLFQEREEAERLQLELQNTLQVSLLLALNCLFESWLR